MIKIEKLPLFSYFFKEILAFDSNFKLEFDRDTELFVTGFCQCGDTDCATVYLKRVKPWREETVYDITTNKGLIFLHFRENGCLEFEALTYNFPYYHEIQRAMKGDFSQASDEEYKSVERYFKVLAHESMNQVILDCDF